MKKTALSVAAAIAMTAGSAHAASVYDADGTTFDVDGTIALGLASIDGDIEHYDVGSSVVFSGTQLINQNMSVFAAAELEFASDVAGGAVEVDEAFLGAEFAGIGRVTAGAFDSIYAQQISDVTDLPEEDGFRDLVGDSSSGDTIAFDSAEFGGLRFGVSATIQEASALPDAPVEGANGEVQEDTVYNMQAYLGYTMGDLNLAVGWDQQNEDYAEGDADGDALIGLRADYNVLPNLNVGALYETQDDLTNIGLSAIYGYSMGDVYATVSRLEDDETGTDDMIYGVGANYLVSDNLYVFAEYANGSEPEVPGRGGFDDNRVYVGANYDF